LAVAARATALEAQGRVGEALQAWQGLAEDLPEDAGPTAAPRQAARLGAPGVRALERVRKQVERDAEWIDGVNDTLALLGQDPPPALPRLLREIGADALRTQAASADPVVALSAARRLNSASTAAGFYLPQQLEARGLLANAVRSYELAAALDPDAPGPWLGLARVEARRGNRKAGLDALRAAVAHGLRLPRQRVAEDPGLLPLAGDPAFAEILAALPD
jgi:tetratricopeptide (TPR) repeat protein